MKTKAIKKKYYFHFKSGLFNPLKVLIFFALISSGINLITEGLALSSMLFTLAVLILVDLAQDHTFPRILILMPLLAALSNITHDLVLSFSLASVPLLLSAFFGNNAITLRFIRPYLLLALPTLIFLFLAVRRGTAGLSIFMNGDGRNHVLLMRNVILNGFVTNEQQANYPSHTYLLPAAIAKSQDAPLSTLTNVLSLGVGYTVAIFLMINLLYRLARNIGISNNLQFIVLGICIPSSGILGFVLANGFYTTLWGIAVLLTLQLATMNFSYHSVLKQLSICVIYSNLLYGTWALLAPIPILIFFMSLMSGRKWVINRYDLVYVVLGMIYSCYSIFPAFFTSTETNIFEVLRLDGGITPINTPIAILLWIFVMFAVKNGDLKRNLVAIAALMILVYSIVGFARLQNNQSFSGYYNQKIIWIGTASVLPIAIGFLLTSIPMKRKNEIASTVLASLVMMGSMSSYQFTQIKMAIFDWGGPSGLVASKVFETDSSEPKIFWYFQDPGNDRLGTFWASLQGNPIGDKINFSKIAVWAYGQTGRPEDLCAILAVEPDLKIITLDKTGVRRAIESCPNSPRLNFIKN